MKTEYLIAMALLCCFLFFLFGVVFAYNIAQTESYNYYADNFVCYPKNQEIGFNFSGMFNNVDNTNG